MREWQMVPWDTPTDVKRRRDLRRADALLSDPSQMAAFRARLGLLAEAASSASRSEETRHSTGELGTAGLPGPAGMVGRV